jgi:Mrp family chromosome partitioning ATPase
MLIRNDIERISRLFKEWIRDKKIMDYKIVLLLNSRIEIHFLVDIKLDTQALFADYEAFKGLEKLITFYQIEFEEEDDKAFFAGDKLDLGLRRRLTNFIRPNKRAVQKPCPVLTFYSYKGGTGRTTTLAFFASWLATHHQKKVVILDCDFEAPGLTNYFDISEDRKGVAEYLFDAYYAQLKGETLDIKRLCVSS